VARCRRGRARCREGGGRARWCSQEDAHRGTLKTNKARNERDSEIMMNHDDDDDDDDPNWIQLNFKFEFQI
jgi:hypothetical protein